MERINENIKAEIKLFRELKEDKRNEEARVKIDLLSKELGVKKSLTRALLNYEIGYCGGWMLTVIFQKKTYWENFVVNKLSNQFLDFDNKYQALEKILENITEK